MASSKSYMRLLLRSNDMEYCRTSSQPASGTSSILMQTLFSSKLVHSLLAREIVVDGVGDFELYFGVGGRRFIFLKYEFCLLTGLKFGGQTHFSAYNNSIVKGSVLQRYWPNGKIDVVTYRCGYVSKVQGLSIERIH